MVVLIPPHVSHLVSFPWAVIIPEHSKEARVEYVSNSVIISWWNGDHIMVEDARHQSEQCGMS